MTWFALMWLMGVGLKGSRLALVVGVLALVYEGVVVVEEAEEEHADVGFGRNCVTRIVVVHVVVHRLELAVQTHCDPDVLEGSMICP